MWISIFSCHECFDIPCWRAFLVATYVDIHLLSRKQMVANCNALVFATGWYSSPSCCLHPWNISFVTSKWHSFHMAIECRTQHSSKETLNDRWPYYNAPYTIHPNIWKAFSYNKMHFYYNTGIDSFDCIDCIVLEMWGLCTLKTWWYRPLMGNHCLLLATCPEFCSGRLKVKNSVI